MLCVANTAQAVENIQYNFCIMNQQLSQASEESIVKLQVSVRFCILFR
jgi:hypothetical protein